MVATYVAVKLSPVKAREIKKGGLGELGEYKMCFSSIPSVKVQ
jgi:hypothetical protein